MILFGPQIDNINLAIFINLLIYSVFLLAVPIIFTLVISLIKPKLSKSGNFYLYAFSSAILLIVGTVGLIGDGIKDFQSFIETNSYISSLATSYKILISVFSIAGACFLGLLSVIGIRYLFVKIFGEIHINHSIHQHNDHIFNENEIEPIDQIKNSKKHSILVIVLLLTHRMIDGFVLGSSVAHLTNSIDKLNIGLLIVFNIHIILEILIVYYRQIQYGQKRSKAVINTILTLLMIIPVMFIGAFINRYLEIIGWLLPLVSVSGGCVLSFVSVIELAPEFIHFKKAETWTWYKILIFFALGIIIAISLIMLDMQIGH